MTEFLYRFRSVEALLGERQELKNQDIYFAAPDQLNDPVEGYKNIFWSGDTIIWKNLLKNYLLCLEQVCSLFIISGEDHQMTAADIPVFKTIKDLPTPQYKLMYLAAQEMFFKNHSVRQFPKWLSARKSPIRRNELYFYLRNMHYYALKCVFSSYEKHNLMRKGHSDSLLDGAEKHISDEVIFKAIEKLESENPEKTDIVDGVFAAQKHIFSQIDWISLYNNHIFSNDGNRRLILLEFPELYLQRLEILMHQDWYTACFLEDYHNSSMWGHYGSNHKGICLKFRTKTQNKKPYITLRGITGVHGNLDNSSLIYGNTDFPFYKVEYKPTYPEIDFFRSIGCQTISDLEISWYMDEDKNRSVCSEHLYQSEHEWRQKYWEDFYTGISTKLEDWAYEKEHRLLLSSMFSNYEEPSRRSLKYNFCDLEGIIFGIKTLEKEKREIMSVIQDKCKLENRDNFKFYQAYYSNHSGRIEAAEMGLISF